MEKSENPHGYNAENNQQTNIDEPSQPHQVGSQQRPKTFKEKMAGKFVLAKSDT